MNDLYELPKIDANNTFFRSSDRKQVEEQASRATPRLISLDIHKKR
ncbi:hypothetical protein ACU8KH_02788 [Lachancea thermotolerans]